MGLLITLILGLFILIGVLLVKIPKNISEIDKDAFKDCKNIIISGKIDSYANTYADENKIDFKEAK